MASESIGLDDIVTTLVSMGFEFDDCQEAIINGKLTVQAAIDWLLSGKPGNVVDTQPSLKLNKSQTSGQLQGNTSNPFVPENVTALRGSTSSGVGSSSCMMGVDVDDDTVVSRSHLSEKQQQIKQSFEEKERNEARRKVNEEKRQRKLERERILKEIQEDREKVRLTKQLKTEPVPLQQTQVCTSPVQQPDAAGVSSQRPEDTSDGTTAIQVRLPSGRIYRHSFPVTATLNSVWDAVYNQLQTAMLGHSGFIQPFPRREFTRDEMRNTLLELGLVPSGSLVLKKTVADQAGTDQEPTQPAAIMKALDEADRDRQEQGNEEGWGEEASDQAEHQWGRGFRVEDRENLHDDHEMGMDIDDPGDDDDDDDENAPGDIFNQIAGLGQHPILGQPQVFQGFGQRLVPAGIPGDNDRHLRRGAAAMAAEAAAQRSANPQPPEEPNPRPSQTEAMYTVRSLQDLAMFALARRLTDPRNPIYSMSGLSEELLQKFLAYLMKERLLKPKILHLMPRLSLDYYLYTTNELLHSARIFVHLQSLSLISCSLITDSGLSALTGMKSLRTLNLSGCSQITNSCFAVLSELPNLQSLSLEGTSVTDPSVIQFANSGSCPHLHHLDLSRTPVTHEIFMHLQKFAEMQSLYLKATKISSLVGLDGVVTLENLDISDTNIVTDSVLCLTRLPSLRQVSLTGTQEVHGDKALYYLKDLKLTSLLLPSRSTTTDIGMAYISGFILTSLDLTNYTNISDAGMVYIGQIVSLKKLLLTNTKVSDEGVQLLSGLVHLEVLFLDRTFLSNAGAAVVSNFKNLNELSLSETSITGDFLKQGILNNCINLTKLNMSKTIIGDKGIFYLKVPNLQYLNLDCTHVHQYTQSIIEKNCPKLKKVTIVTLSSVMEVEEN